MDSGNSDSLHSSSGGAAADEDYDSRTESISSFFNHSSSTHFNNPNQNPILQTLNPTFFNPSSPSYFPPSNTTNLNAVFDPIWSRNLPPDPTFTGFGATQNDDHDLYLNSQPPVSSISNMGRTSDHHQVGVAMKNPKKRTRASRRATTTVLTTDTANFRQMVQEFTGIPTAPFAAVASSTYHRRLDHFTGAGIGSLFPLRPSPQRTQLHQPNITSVDASSSNYQLPPSDIQGFQKQPHTLLNMQNPLFSLQSLLQTKLPQQVNGTILGTAKSDNRQADLLSGFTSSSTRWRGPNDNLVSFDGVNSNTLKLDGYKVSALDFDHQTDKDLENVISSRNVGDEAQG